MIISAQDTNNFAYYTNTTKAIIYAHNKLLNTMTRIYKSDWASYTMEVIKITKQGEIRLTLDWETIMKEDNDIFTVIKPIASTTKQAGYFEEYIPEVGLYQKCLNEYLNSAKFIEALENSNPDNDPIELLEKTCPNIYLLLDNLFYNESKEVLQNFLNWLHIVAYKNRRQDIFWLFKGTNEDKQGQGAGKGVFRDIMSKLLSGLVVSVNNQSYKSNFNSKLMNMKLIIFDEVDMKKLDYEVVKDMTGSSSMPIEFKGKDIVMTENVSSWLFFTNMYDLFEKINITDRRCFLIHPNPLNDSLSKRVNNMEQFIKNLYSELDNFITVLAHCNGKVLKPNELQTYAHNQYFSNKALSSISDIPSISKVFTKQSIKLSYVSFLEDLEKIDTISYKEQVFFIENKFLSYKTFLEIYNLCLDHSLAGINKQISPEKAWKNLKEDLLKNHYEEYKLDRKTTVNGEQARIRESCIRHIDINKVQQKKITNFIVNQLKKTTNNITYSNTKAS